jgi:hypothetical protein
VVFERFARDAVQNRRRREAEADEVAGQMSAVQSQAAMLGREAARTILDNGGRPQHTVLESSLAGYRVAAGFWSSWSMTFDRPVPRLFLVEDGLLVHTADYQCNGNGVWPMRGRPLTTSLSGVARGPVIVAPTPHVLGVVSAPHTVKGPIIVAEPNGVLRLSGWDLEELLGQMVAKALA